MAPADPVDPTTLWTAAGVISGIVLAALAALLSRLRRIDHKVDDARTRLSVIEDRSKRRRRGEV